MPEPAKVKALREFAITRSCNAAIAANENSRPMAQSALLINGAAASAVIAFLTKDKIDPVIMRAIPWALIFYAGGVVCGAVAMYFMTESLDLWNAFWESIVRDEPRDVIAEQERRANQWWGYVQILFFVSIGFFVLGSGTLACAILRMPLPV